ncbi:hypothetical protein [Pseudoalteromonas piscicida]|uniref:Uncharacterized protein n=1 Tax=Pseudoalteromonas piscicida TaxID=43662 RepID=A0A2A5JL74_PSEO7|nr:hypothetical protein [Pseudoalteromonas piscicida]PCK30203.1 hypothetical protein CEX98_18795 [Pseudoalteromonas piscicida]
MKKILPLLFTITPLFAQAGSTAESATIVRLMSDKNYPDYTFVELNKRNASGGPSCGNSTTWNYVLDTSDAQGKKFNAVLLAAFAAGKKVTLAGTDNCPAVNVEGLRRIEIY